MLLIDTPGKISTQHLLNHIFQLKMTYNCNSKIFPSYAYIYSWNNHLGQIVTQMQQWFTGWVFCSKTRAGASVWPFFPDLIPLISVQLCKQKYDSLTSRELKFMNVKSKFWAYKQFGKNWKQHETQPYFRFPFFFFVFLWGICYVEKDLPRLRICPSFMKFII